jgi:hypothetical protein
MFFFAPRVLDAPCLILLHLITLMPFGEQCSSSSSLLCSLP